MRVIDTYSDFYKIIKFIFVGGLNTLVGFVVFAFSIYITNGNISLSLLSNIGIGIFFNYLSYGVGVFKSLGQRQFTKFVIVYLALFMINYVAHMIGRHWGVNVYLAQFVNLFYMAPLSYYLLSRFVFIR